MKHNRRKGFTIIELVIVIAVVAILTAILIPTFMGISEKAGEASNETFVRNINTKLAMNEASTGKKNPTMYDAIKAGREMGFDVEKITPYNNNDIIWDQTNDRFAIVKDGFDRDKAQDKIVYADPSFNRTQDTYKFWKVYDAVPTTPQTYSIYARAEKWAAKDVAVNVGFDAGDNDAIETVSYSNLDEKKDPVILRTVGGKLKVTAPLDEIKHYQTLNTLDIQKAAPASYHEYGEVSFANIKEGHLAFEEGSSIDGIHFQKKENPDEINVYDSFEKIIVSYAQGVEQPNYYRDSVNMIHPEDGTLVCTLILPTEANNIYLMRDGIYEQIAIAATDRAGTETGAAKQWVSDSTTATEHTQNASDQIANQYKNRESAIDYTGGEVPHVDADTRELLAEEAATVVKDNGATVSEAEAKTIASKNVKAEVTKIDNPSDIHYGLIQNNEFANEAYLDVAYCFKAFGDEEWSLVDKFLESGRFTNNLDTFTNENVIAALDYVEQKYGKETRDKAYALCEARIPYFTWLCDFEVSFDNDVEVGSVSLAGYYGAFSEQFFNGEWLGFGMANYENNAPIDIEAGKTVRLLDTMYNLAHIEDFHMNYLAICAYVQEFRCGATNLSAVNAGTTMTVKLCIYKTDANGEEIKGDDAERIVCGTYEYTFGEEVSAQNQEYINQKKS